MAQTDSQTKDARSGMTPDEQLEKIYEAVAPLYKERIRHTERSRDSFILMAYVDWILRSLSSRKESM